MRLTKEEERMLDGEHGEAVQWAMALLVKVGDYFGTASLVDVKYVNILEIMGSSEKSGLELILSDGSLYDHKGKADFVNREVDPATGALLIQASFPNPDELLRPGQFARVKGEIEVVKDGILIPQRCVIELQGTFTVYVVGAENKIQAKEVKVGPKIKSFWLIREGLKAGEKVVYEGLQKVKDGTVVEAEVKEIPFSDEKKSDSDKEKK